MIVQLKKDNLHYTKDFLDVRDLNVDQTRVERFIENENNICLFEVIDGKVVGLVWGYVLERMDCEPMMYVHSVDVVEEYRRRGIAKRLVGKFIEIANQRGYRNTFLITDKDNISGNKLYQSLGGEQEIDKVLYIFKEGEKHG